MAFPGQIYAPPGVYTETTFETPTEAPIAGVTLPILIGTGNEELQQVNLEVVRGSSASVDQQVPQEDATGRAVVSVLDSGEVVLGNFDGVIRQIQTRNFPIVDGLGSGTTTNNPANVVVTINNIPVVVLAMDGAKGILDLSVAPNLGDDVRVTYFFNRTDTQTTDDVSAQISNDPAVVQGQIGEPVGGYSFNAANNELQIRVDGADFTINLGTGLKSANTVVTLITSATTGSSLVASTFTNNFGDTAVQLLADQDIEILNGSANSVLGFTQGTNTNRNRVFFVFNGPIVDGSNGGITTTDPADVTVRVNNVQVIPTAVDGANRAVTLPFAPATSDIVTITYFFNSYQDTFDFLANINISEIVRTGIVPDDSTFTQGVDYILKDDKIVWGSAFLVNAGTHTDGAAFFNETQITASLVDVKAFMEVATPVVNQNVNPPVENRLDFQLPFVPTTGNGRSTPLSQDLFNSITNGRIDLPTFRPDLIQAFWGFSMEDALIRGEVEVTKVEGTTMTLKEPVPVGATVFANFYYNILTDGTFTIKSEVPGASGVGQYSITDENQDDVFIPRFGTKSAGLGVITVQFPSGSEDKPDVRFEGGTQVEETVTVTFDETDSTLAKFTVRGSDPYFTIQDASDHARLLIDGTTLASGASGIDVSRVNGVEGLGFPASFLGDEIVYDEDTGTLTYPIDQGVDDELAVTVDGVLVTGTAAPNATGDASDYVDALNDAARGSVANAPIYTGATRFLGDTVVTAGEYDELEFSYTGDVSGPSGVLTATIAPATYGSPAALASAVEAAIAGAGLPAGATVSVDANADGQMQITLDTVATVDADVQATGTITVVIGTEAPGDTITIGGVALTAVAGPRTSGANDFDISSGVAATIAADIAAAVNDPLNAFTFIVTAADVGPVVTFTAVPTGTAGNSIGLLSSNAVAFVPSGALLAGGLDNAGAFLEFTTHGTPAQDFAVLAGLSTDTVGGAQVKMLHTDIARRFTVAGASGRLIYDRIVLRGRLVPGAGSMAPFHSETQAGIQIEGSTGSTKAGLPPNALGIAGQRGVVSPATVVGTIPVSGNQVPTGTYGDERDGQPLVTFYAEGGTNPQNNVFRFTIDGVAMTTVFTDAAGAAIPIGGSADVPLGPVTIADTILAQIRATAVAAGFSAVTVLQEGAGIRIVSDTTTTDSVVTISDGNANGDLGFSQGSTANRSPVEAGKLASALMADHAATPATFYLGYQTPSATQFAGLALAGVEADETNAEFLYLQSQAATGGGLGTSSNITWLEPSAGNGSVLLPGTGLLTEHNEGSAGEDGISGFYVTSSDPEGSGTADTSAFNSGVGQDGAIGQTYRDAVTGLTFVVLEREGGGNYPAGESFTFEVRKIVKTDANLPVNAIPGVELIVSNTVNVPTGDTAVLETFVKEGAEPAIGDVYFTTYNFRKTNFNTQFFTRTNAIEAAFGTAGPDAPLSLAGSLAKQNGALIVGCKQVLKDDGSAFASIDKFADAIVELEGQLPGGASPDIITPLPVGSTVTEVKNLLVQYGQHADIQSSIRFRAERTIVSGTVAGTQPAEVSDTARTVNRSRVRVFYPDIVQITLTDALGNEDQTFIDGLYIAAAFLGVLAGTDTDVATPWTRRRIIGFDSLGRILTEVDKNQIAVNGVTIVEDRPSNLVVRQGLTTQMENILTRLPTIITIADEVQQRSRISLDSFIGVKFLPGILSQVEGELAETLKGLVEAQILTAYAGIRAQTALDNPTVANVSAFYRPVFPLLFLVLQFGLQASPL